MKTSEKEMTTKSEDEKETNTCCEKILYFYNAPAVKFSQHIIIYGIFLALMTYTLITRFYIDIIEWNEIVLCIFDLGFIVSEIRQVLYLKSNKLVNLDYK